MKNSQPPGNLASISGDDRIQPMPEILDPRPGLLQRGPVHRPFPRRSAAVVVNDVVAADRHDDDAERVFVLDSDLRDVLFEAFERVVPGEPDC